MKYIPVFTVQFDVDQSGFTKQILKELAENPALPDPWYPVGVQPLDILVPVLKASDKEKIVKMEQGNVMVLHDPDQEYRAVYILDDYLQENKKIQYIYPEINVWFNEDEEAEFEFSSAEL